MSQESSLTPNVNNMQRTIPLKKIPSSLWNDSAINFSDTLRVIYADTLAKYALTEQAKVYAVGVVGGVSAHEADEHFAKRYLTSCSRVEFAYLDPLNRWTNIHNILNEILSEGRIGILDLACGSGAATLGLITTLIELRHKRILPVLPLSINIVGADYSQRSLDIFNAQLTPLVIAGNKYGVNIISNLVICDLGNATHITNTLAKFTSSHADDYLVLIANISSALEKEGFRDNMDRAMTLILGHLNGKSANILSIEPSISKSEEKGWFKKMLVRALSFFGDWTASNTETSNAKFQYYHYLLGKNINSNVAIKEVTHVE